MLWKWENSYGISCVSKQLGIFIGEVLKKCMEPQNELDKYAVAVADSESNITGNLLKGKSGKYAKAIFYFFRSDPLTICYVKIIWKAVSLRENKGIRIPCLPQFARNCKMIKIWFINYRNWFINYCRYFK